MYYEQFTGDEIKKLNAVGFDVDDNEAIHTTIEGLKVVKDYHNIFYVEMEECDAGEIEVNNRIYQLGNYWWMPFDLAEFAKDYDDIDPDDFYAEDYELDN